jgi:hypothetical protein
MKSFKTLVSALLILLAAAPTAVIVGQLHPIRVKGLWGFIDSSGKVVIQPRFFNIRSIGYDWNPAFSEGLAPVNVNGNWGYVDTSGTIAIKPQFHIAHRFSDGRARVTGPDLRVGYIDRAGDFQISPKYCYGGDYGDFSEGLAAVYYAEECSWISHVGPVSPRTFYVIDRAGKTIIAGIHALGFREGLSPAFMDGKHGYVDRSGKILIAPRFDRAYRFSEGLAVVQVGKWHGFIDRSGKFIVRGSRELDVWDQFSEGLARVMKGSKFGFINGSGKIVIPPIYDDAGNFSEGLAAVNVGQNLNGEGGKWGYIDKTGKVVIDFRFIRAEPFYNGIAMTGDPLLIKSELGYIDKTGKYVWRG